MTDRREIVRFENWIPSDSYNDAYWSWFLDVLHYEIPLIGDYDGGTIERLEVTDTHVRIALLFRVIPRWPTQTTP